MWGVWARQCGPGVLTPLVAACYDGATDGEGDDFFSRLPDGEPTACVGGTSRLSTREPGEWIEGEG